MSGNSGDGVRRCTVHCLDMNAGLVPGHGIAAATAATSGRVGKGGEAVSSGDSFAPCDGTLIHVGVGGVPASSFPPAAEQPVPPGHLRWPAAPGPDAGWEPVEERQNGLSVEGSIRRF